MKVFLVALVLSVALTAAPVLAQTPPPAPAPQPAPPAAEPPRPFPQGAKLAFVNIQRIANESSEGKTSTAKVEALRQKKVNELNDKNKQLQAAQQKLQTSGSVLSESARGQLEKEIEKVQVEIQRAQQDAQAEMQDMQQELQNEFQKKLLPIIQQVAAEKGLQMIFSQADAGIVWADGGLDVTPDVIKRLDTGAATAKPKPKN